MGNGIFISYRRGDAKHAAGRLVDHLRRTFSRDQLFLDIDNIDPGLDFKEVLSEKLQGCDVLLAVIGPGWLSSSDERGVRRLDNSKDYVRIEIETALARDIRVIPVLVDGAPMPDEERLPDTLRPLAQRQAVRLEHERFGSEADNLTRALAKVVTPMNSPGETRQLLQAGSKNAAETVTHSTKLKTAGLHAAVFVFLFALSIVIAPYLNVTTSINDIFDFVFLVFVAYVGAFSIWQYWKKKSSERRRQL